MSGRARTCRCAARSRRRAGVGAGRHLTVELLGLLHELRVAVRQRDQLDAGLARHVDRHPVGHLGHRQRRDLPEHVGRLERGAQQRAAVGQEALRALGALVGRDVLDHVDRHRHEAVLVEDRRGLHGRPALLAGGAQAEAHDRLGAGLAGERAAAGQLLGGHRVAGLVEDLEAVAHPVAGADCSSSNESKPSSSRAASLANSSRPSGACAVTASATR